MNTSMFIFNQKILDEFRTQLGHLCDNLYHVFYYNKVPPQLLGGNRGRSGKRRTTESLGKNERNSSGEETKYFGTCIIVGIC